jgi:DNA-directed RNA polymerase specialized sigma24 family protein
MRRILVERARRKARIRHGGDHKRVELPELPCSTIPDAATILAVDEALTELSRQDAEAAEIVKLHFFAGLTIEETADAAGVSRATAYRQWAYARARLRFMLRDQAPRSSGSQ